MRYESNRIWMVSCAQNINNYAIMRALQGERVDCESAQKNRINFSGIGKKYPLLVRSILGR